MTIFAGTCAVNSCPFNLGARGLTCGWLRNGRGRCHHPTYREAWALAHELEQAQAQESAPARSLTGRAAAAHRPLTPKQARQLALTLITDP
jgi:hypothetical protein